MQPHSHSHASPARSHPEITRMTATVAQLPACRLDSPLQLVVAALHRIAWPQPAPDAHHVPVRIVLDEALRWPSIRLWTHMIPQSTAI
jgi:hypothetical protein